MHRVLLFLAFLAAPLAAQVSWSHRRHPSGSTTAIIYGACLSDSLRHRGSPGALHTEPIFSP